MVDAGRHHWELLKAKLEAARAPLTVLALVAGAVALDRAYQALPGDPYQRGLGEIGAGRYDDAIADFSRALRRNPSDPASRFGLAWAYHMRGWADEAIAQYEKAGGELASEMHFNYHNLGVILQSRGENDKAEQAYLRSLAVNPDATNSLTNIATIYEQRGQFDRLIRVFDLYLERHPEDAGMRARAEAARARLKR